MASLSTWCWPAHLDRQGPVALFNGANSPIFLVASDLPFLSMIVDISKLNIVIIELTHKYFVCSVRVQRFPPNFHDALFLAGVK